MTHTGPRTKGEAALDARYQIRLHFLHRRLYNRARAVVSAISLVAGSGAIVSALQAVPNFVAICGVVVAIASALDLVFNWAERAAKHGIWQKELAELLSKDLELPALDAALALHDGEVDDEIESLRVVAFNDNVRSNGHEDWVRPETFGQRLMRGLA